MLRSDGRSDGRTSNGRTAGWSIRRTRFCSVPAVGVRLSSAGRACVISAAPSGEGGEVRPGRGAGVQRVASTSRRRRRPCVVGKPIARVTGRQCRWETRQSCSIGRTVGQSVGRSVGGAGRAIDWSRSDGQWVGRSIGRTHRPVGGVDRSRNP